MGQQFYIVAVDKKGGGEVYCRIPEGSSPNSYSCSTTTSPELARKFAVDRPDEVLQWMDRIKSSISRTCNSESLRGMIFEMNLRRISDDDSDWNKALRMSAISKLTEQEIIALGLQKHEIERRLNAE